MRQIGACFVRVYTVRALYACVRVLTTYALCMRDTDDADWRMFCACVHSACALCMRTCIGYVRSMHARHHARSMQTYVHLRKDR